MPSIETRYAPINASENEAEQLSLRIEGAVITAPLTNDKSLLSSLLPLEDMSDFYAQTASVKAPVFIPHFQDTISNNRVS